MEPTVLSREETHVIGFTFTANVTEDLEQKHSASTTEALRARKSEIHNQVGKGEYLIQIYPDKDDFDAAVDPFTTLIGVAVSSLADIPEGMVSHTIPAGTFAKVTHKDLRQTWAKHMIFFTVLGSANRDMIMPGLILNIGTSVTSQSKKTMKLIFTFRSSNKRHSEKPGNPLPGFSVITMLLSTHPLPCQCIHHIKRGIVIITMIDETRLYFPCSWILYQLVNQPQRTMGDVYASRVFT